MQAVSLVSITRPEAKEITNFTPEEVIVYIARVSNPSNQLNVATSERLLKYLIDHSHWSPFEFIDMTVEIVTRRSIAAQILRHKSFSFQEFSQRYSSVSNIQEIDLRLQSSNNRQSSSDAWQGDTSMKQLIVEHIENSMKLYREMLDAGIAREVARDILPLATETRMYMKGSVRSWIHYLQLRTHETTQKEHRDIANDILAIFSQHFPTIGMLITNNLGEA